MIKLLCGAAATAAALSLITGPAVAGARQDAQRQVKQTVSALRKMEAQPHMKDLLKKAKGVFVVPAYGQGGLIVGGHGGEGVLLSHENGRWDGPAFYNTGAISIGAQAGGEGGSVAYLLMTPQALNDVKGGNNFSLNAKAGLSIVNYSAKSEAGWGKADVITWTDLSGAYAGATVGVSDVASDVKEDHAFYHDAHATVDKILNGVEKAPKANPLRNVLAL